MSLKRYRSMRDFKKTAEPSGGRRSGKAALKYVIQKHNASHLHYDFRLEWDGVLRSWAVPKGPSLDPKQKRLAVEVEDHPVDYAGFEGTIPEGEYGGGEVIVWDQGTWTPPANVTKALREGRLEFELHGEKLHGRWMLIRTFRPRAQKPQWLLIKRTDADARAGADAEITVTQPLSVVTARAVEDLAPEKAAPKKASRAKRVMKKKPVVHAKSSSTEVSGVAITHPERTVFDGPGGAIQKLDLAKYYHRVAHRILPYLAGRPLSFVRCPSGVASKCFVQKHGQVGVKSVHEKSSRGGAEVFSIHTPEDLIRIVQNGVIELHSWGCRETDLNHPDVIVFDLDPDELVSFAKVREAAFEVRDVLREMKLESFVNTTGGKGLHVRVPIAPKYTWAQIAAFSKTIAEKMVHHAPATYVTQSAKAKRHGKIFIDYLRNGYGATTVVPFSVRAREDAPIARPLSWDELKHTETGNGCHLADVLKLRALKDPWKGFAELEQTIESIRVRTPFANRADTAVFVDR